MHIIEKPELGLDASDFEIVMPLDKVLSVNLLSLDIEQDLFEVPAPGADSS